MFTWECYNCCITRAEDWLKRRREKENKVDECYDNLRYTFQFVIIKLRFNIRQHSVWFQLMMCMISFVSPACITSVKYPYVVYETRVPVFDYDIKYEKAMNYVYLFMIKHVKRVFHMTSRTHGQTREQLFVFNCGTHYSNGI